MTIRSGWHCKAQRQIRRTADKPGADRRKPAQEGQGRLIRLTQPRKVQCQPGRRVPAGQHERCKAISLEPPIDLDARSLSVLPPSDPEGHGSCERHKASQLLTGRPQSQQHND